MDEKVSQPEPKKTTILILTEQHLRDLNELFDKFVPPAYSRPIIALLNTCPKQEVDVPAQA